MKEMRENLVEIIKYIGDNPEREGLIETPDRIIKSWNTLFSGYKAKSEDIFKVFTEDACEEMVILKNIEFYSTCEHHFLPFFGKISIGYLPNKKVIGISKLARLVEIYARRMQIQEKLVNQIADDLIKYLAPHGCMVIAEAQHLCMTARGVQKQGSVMVTSAIRGNFKKMEIRSEFLTLIK